MPEGGSGFYTDWWNNGERGSPAWESYELNEMLPAILARYRILPQRRYHAIAGTSMGGMGATYLGGRLPGFFGSVGSLSGFVDPQYFGQVTDAAMGLTAEAPLEGDYNLDPIEGPANGFYMQGHNPSALATNLEQTRVFESTGTGVPSSADLAAPTSGGGEVAADYALEHFVIYPMSQGYHDALAAAGVDVTYQVHRGGHLIPDFLAELKALVAWGMFRPVVANPSAWVNDTVATTGQLWDIGYRFAQPPNQVVQFRRSGSSLSISAAGSPVTLTTAGRCVIRTGAVRFSSSTPQTVGVPTMRLHVTTVGDYGQLDARLWDVAPDGMETFVSRGTYALTDNQTGTITWQMWGGGYTLHEGDEIRVELLAQDVPIERPSPRPFALTVSNCTIELPSHEPPDGGEIVSPLLAP